MSIANKITSIKNHIDDTYDWMEIAGADLTNINKNLLNLNTILTERLQYYLAHGLDVVWDNWEKVTATGTTLTLNNTVVAPMKIDLKGDTTQNGTPTPTTPIDIQVVSGDNTINVEGKNLFVPTLTVEGTNIFSYHTTTTLNEDTFSLSCSGIDMYFGNVVSANNSYTNTAGILIPVKSSTTYSVLITNDLFTKNYITQYNSSKVSLGNTKYTTNSFNFTTDASASYVSLRIGIESSTSGTTYTTQIQLSEGTITTYIPYVSQTYPITLLVGTELCKIENCQDIIFKSTGVNLLEGGTEIGSWSYTEGTLSTKQTNDNQVRCSNKIKVSPTTTYILSVNGNKITQSARYIFLDGDGIVLSSISGTHETITTPENCEYLVFHSTALKTTYGVPLPKPMLNIGTTVLPYEPYGEKNKWWLYKEIGKVVLDGTENGWGTTNKTYTLSNIINSAKHSGVSTLLGISNYFKWGNGATATYVYGSFWTNDGGVNLRFQKEETPNLSDFKTWLSTHNTTVYYILATPITTEITDSTLLSQLEDLQSVKSYNEQTNISSISNDLGFELTATALKNV